MPIKIETDEEYHGGEGVSRSTLWKLFTKTPYHARFEKQKETDALDFGKAVHIAILEPESFDARVSRGPAARGNSNEWKHFLDFCAAAGTMPLKPDQYDNCLVMRDLAAGLPELSAVLADAGNIRETSAYHVDEETGVLTKTRVDLYSPEYKLIVDLKTAADASEFGFIKSVGSYGYHMQDAMYSDVWAKGSGHDVDAFMFIVLEKSEPPAFGLYELDPFAKAEGYACYRHAIQQYAECEKSGDWPSYPSGIRRIGLRKWDFKMTVPPQDYDPSSTDDMEDLPDPEGDGADQEN